MKALYVAAYFILIGYYIGKTGQDEKWRQQIIGLHDRWVLHVAGLARKELAYKEFDDE